MITDEVGSAHSLRMVVKAMAPVSQAYKQSKTFYRYSPAAAVLHCGLPRVVTFKYINCVFIGMSVQSS